MAVIQNIDIKLLQPNTGQIEGLPKNPRLIKNDRFKQLVTSIKDDPEMLDLRECIVYPQNGHFVVIAGNMRLQACKELKFNEVPCKVLPLDTSINKLKAYTIKDNISYGEISWDLIAEEWETDQLVMWGLELPQDFNNKEAHEDDYVIPDEIETDIVLGDLFEIGQHRLLCGDSTKAEDVNKLLDGGKPNLMVTDPPYGVSYDAGWRDEAAKYSPSMGNRKDTAKGKVVNDEINDWSQSYSLFNGDVCYVWHADRHAKSVQQNLEDACFIVVNQIIWAKNHIVIGRGDYHWMHEPCWYAVRKGKKHNWQGSRKENTLWQIDKPQKSETGHSTQKPVECMARPIRNNSYERESVYDPFLGSGTTMVAAHQLNRKCYGMEIDPKYCQVIIDRMRKLQPEIEIKKNGIKYE